MFNTNILLKKTHCYFLNILYEYKKKERCNKKIYLYENLV